MSAKITAGITNVNMPAGEYFVGDPCYAVPDERWLEWLEAADYDAEPNPRILIAELDGKPVLGIGTAHGDGNYPGSDGNSYPVDAGLIGVVPVEIGDYSDDKYPAGPIMKRVTFDRPFDCYYNKGMIVLGHIQINTEEYDLDEEGW